MALYARLLGLCALALCACESRDLGPLLDERPCGEACVVDSGVLPDPPQCQVSTATITCGLGVCARAAPACVAGKLGTCAPGDPETETCNDLDDDCDGVIDDGCDDDGDGYCDATMVVTSTPAACTVGGAGILDCDDDNAKRHPGRAEVCDDSVDNDCNDFADYLDIDGCTHLTASFQDSDGVITLEHGTTQEVQAVLTPPTLQLEREWIVASAVPDTHCRADDVTLSDPVETDAATRRRVGILDDPTRLDCEYRLQLWLSGVLADSIALRMRNTRPRVDAMTGATLDDQTLVMVVASGTNPRLTATTSADPDQPVVVTWVGRDAGLLDCTAPCEGLDQVLRAPPAPGTYLFTLNAKDGFDGVNRGRNLRLEVKNCVWVRSGGTGTGTGPALTQAYPNLASGLPAAQAAGADLCLVGTNRINVGASLVLPIGVGLVGGFGTSGLPATTLGAIRLQNGAGISFAPGHTGAVRRVVVDATGPTTLFDVTDASPSFFGADLVMPAGAGVRAIRLRATVNGGATVRLGSTDVRSGGATSDATALEVDGQGNGVARLVWNGASTVTVSGCTGDCRGIWLHGSTSASLTAERIEVESSGASGRAVAIEIQSEGDRRATAEVVAINQIFAKTTQMDPADLTVGIMLDRSLDVRIADNVVIGATNQVAGRRYAAAISDGEIHRDATVRRGDSINLRITGNRQLGAGRSPWAYDDASCQDEASAREGTDVAAGIVLVGTATASILNNGSPSARDTGVFGGASTAAHDPSTRVLPPSVPGLWTVDTSEVEVIGNELRAGVLSVEAGCPPVRLPTVTAVLDGLGLQAPQRLGSRGLRLERNGVVTARRSSFDAVPDLDAVPVELVVLSGGAGSSARLSNNYLAATRGSAQAALIASGVEALELWNNVLEVDALGPRGGAHRQRGLAIEAAQEGSVDLVNNVVVIRQQPEDLSDPVAIIVGTGALPFRQLSHNLLFVEAAERDGRGAYVEVAGQPFTRETFPTWAASIGATGNLILPPLFRSQTLEHRRSITRLSSRSPAIDQGQLEGAPDEDRFATPRPIGVGVDIGHHELGP